LYSLKKIKYYPDDDKPLKISNNLFTEKQKNLDEKLNTNKNANIKISIDSNNFKENYLKNKEAGNDNTENIQEEQNKTPSSSNYNYYERKILLMMTLVQTNVKKDRVRVIVKENLGYLKITYMIKISELQNYLNPIKNELEEYRVTKEKDNKIILEKKNLFPKNSNESTNKYALIKYYIYFKDIKSIAYFKNHKYTQRKNLDYQSNIEDVDYNEEKLTNNENKMDKSDEKNNNKVKVFFDLKKFDFKCKILNKKYIERNGFTKDAFDLFIYRNFEQELENSMFHFPVIKIDFEVCDFFRIFFIEYPLFKKYISVNKEKISVVHIIKSKGKSSICANYNLYNKLFQCAESIQKPLKKLVEKHFDYICEVYPCKQEDLTNFSLKTIFFLFLSSYSIEPNNDNITYYFNKFNESIEIHNSNKNNFNETIKIKNNSLSNDLNVYKFKDKFITIEIKNENDLENKENIKMTPSKNDEENDVQGSFDINFIWVFLNFINEKIISYWELVEYFKKNTKKLLMLFLEDKYILFLTLDKILKKRFSMDNIFSESELQDKIEFYYYKFLSKTSINYSLIDSLSNEQIKTLYLDPLKQLENVKIKFDKKNPISETSQSERDVEIKFNDGKYIEAYYLLNISNSVRNKSLRSKTEEEIETFRLILTPQILNFLPLIKEKTNRIMRNYSDRNKMIRVAVRDAIYKKKFQMDYVITKAFFKFFLKKGLKFNNLSYEFFGYSNSQFRSMSCWLVVEAEKIRKICGDFDNIKSIAKWGARLGQTLSSTYSGFSIDKKYVKYEKDFVTRKDDQINKSNKKEPVRREKEEEKKTEYINIKQKNNNNFEMKNIKNVDHKKEKIYDKNEENLKIMINKDVNKNPQIETEQEILLSDGCGYISYNLANEIRKFLNLDFIPSCFQARFGGNKGVWSLYRTEENFIVCRNSQKKFNSDFYEFEVCEYSRYRKGHLNRQIIILLKSLGAQDEIFFKYLKNHSNILKNDKNFSDFIRFRKIKKIVTKMLEFNINFHNDLFLFSLMKETQSLIFRELTERSRIFVEKSVLLKGIVDEYNLLEENQVFAFISKTNNKKDKENFLLSGKFIVTRCPCLHTVNIRILQFINLDNLEEMENSNLISYFEKIGSKKHLENLRKNFIEYKKKLIKAYDRFKNSYLNVIVFPSKGKTSHPNQMAGGDLDGDDYFIFFDDELVSQIKPIDSYTYPSCNLVIDKSKIEIDDIIDHFVTYNSSNILGKIANLQIAIADQSPSLSNDTTSIKLAELFARAVDAPKTGETIIIPKVLINRVKEFPHFMEKPNKYKSTSILGKLHDEILEIINKENKEMENLQSHLYSFSNNHDILSSIRENLNITFFEERNKDEISNGIIDYKEGSAIKSNSISFQEITFNPYLNKINNVNMKNFVNKSLNEDKIFKKEKDAMNNQISNTNNSLNNIDYQKEETLLKINNNNIKEKLNPTNNLESQFLIKINLEKSQISVQNNAENIKKFKSGLKSLDYKGIFCKIIKNNFCVDAQDKEQLYYLISMIECILFNKKFFAEISDLMNRFDIKSIGELFSGNIPEKNEVDSTNEIRDNLVTLENYLNKIIANLTQLVKFELGIKNNEFKYKVNLYYKAFCKACAYYNTIYFGIITENIIYKNEKLITDIFCESDDYYIKRISDFDLHNHFDSDYTFTSDQNEIIYDNYIYRKNDYASFISENLNIEYTELMKNELLMNNENLKENNYYEKNKGDLSAGTNGIEIGDKNKVEENSKRNEINLDLRMYKQFNEIINDLRFLLKNPNHGLPWIIFCRILVIISDTQFISD